MLSDVIYNVERGLERDLEEENPVEPHGGKLCGIRVNVGSKENSAASSSKLKRKIALPGPTRSARLFRLVNKRLRPPSSIKNPLLAPANLNPLPVFTIQPTRSAKPIARLALRRLSPSQSCCLLNFYGSAPTPESTVTTTRASSNVSALFGNLAAFSINNPSDNCCHCSDSEPLACCRAPVRAAGAPSAWSLVTFLGAPLQIDRLNFKLLGVAQ